MLIQKLLNLIKENKLTTMVTIVIISVIIYYLHSKNIISLFNSMKKKVVVFDLDETLGYWVQIGIIYDSLKKHMNMNEKEVFELFDLFPEIVRPEIIPALNNLKSKKKSKQCDKVIIYTNNQGPTSWANLIKNYLNHKISFNLFDQIIAAYKVNGVHVEKNRTSHIKNVPDLIRCTQLTPDTEICFIDDQHHKPMEHDKVTYIYIKPYKYDMQFDNMIDRVLNSKIINSIKDKDKDKLKIDLQREVRRYRFHVTPKTELEHKVDIIVSKNLIKNINDFFKTKKQTIKKGIKKNGKSKTIKRRRKKNLQG
jgi:hypothetical protein